MKYSVEQWIETVRPCVEKEFGPLLGFIVQYENTERATPWTVRVIHEKAKKHVALQYYPETIAHLLKQYQNAYLTYALIHDLVHVYQMNAALKECGDVDCYKLLFWLEGAAELGTWKILVEWLNDPAKIKLIPSVQTPKAEVKKRFSVFVEEMLMGHILNAKSIGLISKPALASLSLPFSLPKPIARRINELVRIISPNYDPTPAERNAMPYSVGLVLCGKIVSSQKMSLHKLLRTPLEGSELEKLAGI